jgi:hypothetical protein
MASMPANSSLADPCHALPASADHLQRAAGALRRHAGSAHSVPTLPVTLTHVQETLDLLAAGIRQMENAVADRCGQSFDEDDLPPDARALRWHLGATAKALRASREACSASADFARRAARGRRRRRDAAGGILTTE